LIQAGLYRCVADASAMLAFVHREPGAEIVRQSMSGAVMSAVNWSEVAHKALARGVDVSARRHLFVEAGLTIFAFDAEQAEDTAALWESTRGLGLSLADRACLALAQRLDLPVLSADRAWQELQIGVQVQLIR
jgi:ribonuclease VapC